VREPDNRYPDMGLRLQHLWGTQYRYSESAVLLVFASEYYDPDDYIRTYDEFVARRSAVA
jgi:UDP-2-acetamido-3-amino-2,3-dideoxy-glucuronate N-acetyltransferase